MAKGAAGGFAAHDFNATSVFSGNPAAVVLLKKISQLAVGNVGAALGAGRAAWPLTQRRFAQAVLIPDFEVENLGKAPTARGAGRLRRREPRLELCVPSDSRTILGPSQTV